jgi:anti-sigma B factor antagonist
MEIDKRHIDNIVVLAISGKIDAVTSKKLESALMELLDQKNASVIMDFKEVDFISSGGLRLLIAFKKKLAGCSGDLVISSPQPFVMEIFEMTGIPSLICTYPNQADAVQSFKS